MEERNIYVEHNDEWYDYSGYDFNAFKGILSYIQIDEAHKTDKREFEIGSLVYFENGGWTEVIERVGCGLCERAGRGCSNLFCTEDGRADKIGIVFKKYTPETTEKTEEPVAPIEGIKHDSGKLRPGLFPVECFEEISKVLTYGANKYAPDNWKHIDPERYIDALWRHYIAWKTGEKNDAESGLSHAAHFATNAIFLLYFELEKKKGGRK